MVTPARNSLIWACWRSPIPVLSWWTQLLVQMLPTNCMWKQKLFSMSKKSEWESERVFLVPSFWLTFRHFFWYLIYWRHLWSYIHNHRKTFCPSSPQIYAPWTRSDMISLDKISCPRWVKGGCQEWVRGPWGDRGGSSWVSEGSIRVVRFWAIFSNPFKLSIFPLYLLR